jgi:hypothetical protein
MNGRPSKPDANLQTGTSRYNGQQSGNSANKR